MKDNEKFSNEKDNFELNHNGIDESYHISNNFDNKKIKEAYGWHGLPTSKENTSQTSNLQEEKEKEGFESFSILFKEK